MARVVENMDFYGRLYVELELEALQQSGLVGVPGTPDLLAAREALDGRWKEMTLPKQVDLGPRILALRKAFKGFRDAERQFNYAARYRGADDDLMEQGDWRTGFGIFEDKAKKLQEESENLSMRVKNVLDSRTAAAEDPGTIALTGVWNITKTHAANLALDRRIKHVEMNQASEARIKLLERQENRPTTPEPSEPACEPERPGDDDDDDSDDDVEMVDEDDAEPTWHGRLELGRGSYGQAYLWVETDARGKIHHRVVQKVSDLSPMWSKNVWWSNGSPGRMGIGRQTIPNEIRAHRALSGKAGSGSVVELLNYNLRFTTKTADLYLEFCPFGDAYELLRRGYDSRAHGDRIKYDFEDHRPECKFIPEPFCWAAFRSMVLAGLLLGGGTIDTSAEAVDPEWRVIVHRDLKLDNIFLGAPAQDIFRGYPQAKIGDFGGAIFIPAEDPRPREDLMTLSTKDHAAPEMDCALKAGRRDELIVPQSTKTNVWGVGIVMYSLLSGKHGPCHPSEYPQGYFQWMFPERREPPDFDESTRLYYSDDLLNLVLSCLRYDERDRPPFEFLLREVKRFTNPHTPSQDRAAGLKNKSPWQEGYQEGYDLGRFGLDCKADGYACGMALRDVGFVANQAEGDVPANLWDFGQA